MSGTMAATDAPTRDAHTGRNNDGQNQVALPTPAILNATIRVDLETLTRRTRATHCYCLRAGEWRVAREESAQPSLPCHGAHIYM